MSKYQLKLTAVIVLLLITSSVLISCKDDYIKLEFQECFADDPKMLDFVMAVDAGKIKSMRRLRQQNNINVNYIGKRDWTPLLVAMNAKQMQSMKELLAMGADPNLITPRGYSPIYLAVNDVTGKILKLLLDHGGNPNILQAEYDKPLIHRAMSTTNDNFTNIKLLLQHGANVNAKWSGKSLFLNTLTSRNYRLAAYLLEQNIPLEIDEIARIKDELRTADVPKESQWKIDTLKKLLLQRRINADHVMAAPGELPHPSGLLVAFEKGQYGYAADLISRDIGIEEEEIPKIKQELLKIKNHPTMKDEHKKDFLDMLQKDLRAKKIYIELD